MREILFRGKRVDNGEWMEDSFFYNNWGEKHCILPTIKEPPISNSASCFDVIPETVGQYTGLTDKNGKKIFDVDIVKVNTGDIEKNGYGVVEYLQCGCAFIISGFLDKPYRDQYHQRQKGEFYRQLQEWLVIEIIGNVYDNPKLLEVEK